MSEEMVLRRDSSMSREQVIEGPGEKTEPEDPVSQLKYDCGADHFTAASICGECGIYAVQRAFHHGV